MTMQSTIDQAVLNSIDKHFESIATEVKLFKVIPLDKQYWDVNDVAAYLKISVSHTRNNIIGQDSFPKPKKLNFGGKNLVKRWNAKQVIDWVEYQPNTANHSIGRPRKE